MTEQQFDALLRRDIRHDWAARASAQIVNLHLHSDDCKALVYGKILFLIRFAMCEAEAELNELRYHISEN